MWKDPPSTWTALPRAAQVKTTGLSSFPLLALGLPGDFLYFVAFGADSMLTSEAASFKFQCGLSLYSPGIPRPSLKPGLQGSLAPRPGQLLGSEPLHCWTTLTNRSWKQAINSLLIKKNPHIYDIQHVWIICELHFIKICDVNSDIPEYIIITLLVMSHHSYSVSNWNFVPLPRIFPDRRLLWLTTCCTLLLGALPCQIPQRGSMALVFLTWFTPFSIRLTRPCWCKQVNSFFFKVQKHLVMYVQHVFIITQSTEVDAYGDYIF